MKASAFSISVIIPAYNAEAHLAETLQSVLGQSLPPDEIVLVDDGSKDGTPKIAKSTNSPLLKYFRQENAGLPAALNAGLRLASGDLLMFLDADDLWPPGKSELHATRMREHPEIEIVLGHQQRMWRPPQSAEWRYKEPELALALQSSTIRRRVFDKVGWFDEALQYSNDWDWFFRAREMGVPFLTLPEVASYYRRHDTNMTENEETARRGAALVVKRSLDRRRAAAGIARSLDTLVLKPGQAPRHEGE